MLTVMDMSQLQHSMFSKMYLYTILNLWPRQMKLPFDVMTMHHISDVI